jgi:hypothetical protein
MLLGLLFVLVGISLGLIPLPGSLVRYVAFPTSETLEWICWILIVIGIILALVGYFRKEAASYWQ